MAIPTIRAILNGILSPITVDDTVFELHQQKWQFLLYEAMDITEANAEVESEWPYLARLLIAYLVVRDLVNNAATQQIISNAASVTATTEAGSSSSSGVMSGAIKKIETGPVNVERHDAASASSSLSKVYTALFNREGLWEEIQSQICSLANRLAVHISGCKDKPIIPMKVIRASDYSYQDQYPITPGTVERPAE